MTPNADELRKNYEKFGNNKLIRIATEEATSLRPEALKILREIIKERGLSEDITAALDSQFKPMTEAKLTEYCELMRRLPCPECDTQNEKLNATITGTVISFVLMTHYRKVLKIACPTCLDKLNQNATVKSALMGWWGLPWGVIRTPQAIILNNKMKRENHLIEANHLFKSFVLQRIGRIEANRNNPDGLRRV